MSNETYNPMTRRPLRTYPQSKRRERLNISGSTLDLVTQMSEGNPGAVTALCKLIDGDDMALMRILDLDDMGMRGSQIWVAYKDHCKGDIEAFRKALRDRDPEMVKTVNASRGHADGMPLAVTHGAS